MVGVSRVGVEVQVNSDPSDYPYANAPAMVRMANGNFLVLWSESNTAGDGSGASVKAQVLTATGARVGAEFVVNTTTAGDQAIARASVLSDGTIFVAWQDGSQTGGDTSGNAIRGQLLSATAAKVGSEFLINTTTTGGQAGPAVSALNNGNVLVTWNDASQTGGDTSSNAVRAQIVTPAGVRVGSEFVVNTNTTGSQAGSKIAVLGNGNVVVTWTDASGATGDTDGSSIRAQILDPSGNRIGGEFQVNTNIAGNQSSAAVVALANGNFVVTWQDSSGTLGDASGSSIKAQIFDFAGHAVGGEFLVNSLVSGAQSAPAIARLDSGDFVITWVDFAVPGTPTREDLRGQLFAPDGTRVGAEFVADSPVANLAEGSPGIVALADNAFAIASATSLVDGNGVFTSRGERVQIFAGSRELFGTVGADQLVGARGADVFHATQGHDTFDGRGGPDRVIVDADDHSLFPVTTGSVTYMLSNNVLTNSVGTLDATLVSVEQIDIYDTSSANHIFNYTGQVTVPNRVTVIFGDGDDRVVGGGVVWADLGLGNNVVQGRVPGTIANSDGLTLTVRSGSSLVTVTDVGPPTGNGAGIAVAYSTGVGASLTTITDFDAYGVQAAAGQGLRIDASNSLSNVGFVDSPYDDLLIGGRGDNIFISYNRAGVNGGDADLSGGVDYKYGNGGADTYDYSFAIPHIGGDHLMDVDSDDVLDFSYYGGTSLLNGPNPRFVGTAAFTGTEREIRYETIDGKTYIYTDIDGDTVVDGTVIIENGAFDLVAVDDYTEGENRLMMTLAQNFVNGTVSGEMLNGTSGADVIRAYQGDDTIRVTSGQDFIDGGVGNDVLIASLGDTAIFAAPTVARTCTIGADRMFDTSGVLNTSFLEVERVNFSTVGTGNYNDVIDAERFAGSVALIAGAGNDTLRGAMGADALYGGAGNDVYTVNRQDDLVFENTGEGIDTVISTSNFYLYANIENLTLASGAGNIFGVGNELANNITGNEGDNTLLAGAGADVVHGGAGVDIIYGEDGNDQLFGDANNDFLAGGAGDDVMDGGTGGDSVYGEAGNDTLTGGASFEFDILVGGDGNDVLRGDSGFGDYDYLYGNTGDDSFYVDTGDDLTFEQAGEGTDTVYANVAGANNGVYLYANIENLVLLGTTTFGVGNELANTMTGNASGNYLLGGAGNDILNGKAGGDVLFGEAGADTFVFEHGTGGDVIGDFVLGTDRIDLTAIGYTWQQVQNSLHENGGSTAIDLGNGDLVVLNGVTIAQLHQADFILAGGGSSGSAPLGDTITTKADVMSSDPATLPVTEPHAHLFHDWFPPDNMPLTVPMV